MISKVYAIVTLSTKVAPFEVMIVGKKKLQKEMVNQRGTVVNSRGERKTAYTEHKSKYLLHFHELFVNGFKSNLMFFFLFVICSSD